MFEKETLYLKKDKLMESDFDSSLRAYLQKDVTSNFKRKLFQHCEIAEGTTLADIISFMEKDLPFWAEIIGFDVKLFIEESKKIATAKKDTEVKYLELYYHIESHIYREREFSGILHPGFHGVGFASKKEAGPFGIKKGGRINYSVSLTPVNELAHLEVRLSPDSTLVINEKNYKKKPIVHNLGGGSYSLMGIIYGIFWELSFYGSPNQRSNVSSGLNKQMSQIKKTLGKKKKKSKGKK